MRQTRPNVCSANVNHSSQLAARLNPSNQPSHASTASTNATMYSTRHSDERIEVVEERLELDAVQVEPLGRLARADVARRRPCSASNVALRAARSSISS